MTKTKERQRKVTSRAKHKLDTENRKKTTPEHVDAKLQILDAFFLNFH
jgi:hypothetical protein